MDARPPLLPATAAPYLDFDGTLADFALHPDDVVVSEPLPQLLLALRERLAGAVAVVTGRRLATVDAMIAPARLPGAGLHGAEWRLGGAAEKLGGFGVKVGAGPTAARYRIAEAARAHEWLRAYPCYVVQHPQPGLYGLAVLSAGAAP